MPGRSPSRPAPRAARARPARFSESQYHTRLVDTDRRSRARRRWSATDRGRSLNLRTPYLLYSTVHGSPRISHGGRGSGGRGRGRAVPVPVAPDGRSLDRDLDALRERRAMSVPCVELRKLTMNSCFIVSIESCLCLCRLVGERGSVRLVRRAYMYGGEPSKKKKRKHVMLDGGKRKGKQEKKRKTASCWRDGNQMDDRPVQDDALRGQASARLENSIASTFYCPSTKLSTRERPKRL